MRRAILGALALAVVAVVGYFFYARTRESFAQNPDLDTIIAGMLHLDPILGKLNFYEGEKSYTINKKNVYICMKNEAGGYYDKNFLVYVILHEISHALCDEIGHTQKFMAIFADMIDRAARMGLYDKDKPKVENYCNYRK
jgi:hypothetical protein